MSERTLVLNASYEALAVVPLRRAVILVLAEKAEIVAANGTLHSQREEFPLPRVIRLTRYVRVPYVRRVPVTRRAVLQRDHYECAYCAGRADTMDHVVPKHAGGRHSWLNIVAACRHCNNVKGHKSLAELGWTLRFKPFEPAGTVALLVVVGTMDAAWQPYLAGA